MALDTWVAHILSLTSKNAEEAASAECPGRRLGRYPSIALL